ncbi:hypothetical protein [Clostridium sp. OS1-26]|uniref:hypothetical protein n=1 Tax=Clostridium sp. OS1-26 TaxID=3070681 RepID=UPI0027E037CB|nr:hypothetical protein [Clostridium sp. OS1-26]WML33773.1 hypothetical protein RCG18_20910 [Clostridium sp. OS1-26]
MKNVVTFTKVYKYNVIIETDEEIYTRLILKDNKEGDFMGHRHCCRSDGFGFGFGGSGIIGIIILLIIFGGFGGRRCC